MGHVLALKKEVMEHGSEPEKTDHLMSVLTPFLHNRVSQKVKTEAPQGNPSPDHSLGVQARADNCSNQRRRKTDHQGPTTPISQPEADQFKRELGLLDDSRYFRTIFEKP